MINVTKAFLPPMEEYTAYLKGIWERTHLTNFGPISLELENKLRKELGVKYIFFVNNGTIALQIAIKSLRLQGEIITTPFSYVATTSTIAWEGCTPVFADIEKNSLCLDPNEIEKNITKKTVAIMATHVYGNPCDVMAIDVISKKYKIPVIYDAAHAFGVEYDNSSILNYGDISTLSFHATKLFHTVEGGAIVTNNDEIAHKISYMRNFGHNGSEAFWGVGINGKNSEFHAAMGLAVLPYVPSIVEVRKELSQLYDRIFENTSVVRPIIRENTKYNFSYYPIIVESEEKLLAIREALIENKVMPRRYFYPSLNTLSYVDQHKMPVSEYISERVLCLPLFYELEKPEVERIANIVKENI